MTGRASVWNEGFASPVSVSDLRWQDLRSVLTALVLCGVLLAGLVSGNGPLTTAGVGASIVVALVSPTIGLMILVFIAPLLSRPLLPAPGYPLVLAAAVVLGAIYRLPIERPMIRIGAPLALGLGFVAIVFVNQLPALMAGYASIADRFTGSLMTKQLAALLVVIGAALRMHRRSPYPVLAMIILSGVVATAVAVTNGPDGGGPFSALEAATTDAQARASGSFGNPNEYGSFVALIMTLTVGLLVASRDRLTRIALALVVAFLAIGLALAFSRSAMLGLGAGLVTLALVRDRRIGMGVLLATIMAFVIAYPFLVDARLSSSLGSASPAAQMVLANSDAGRLERVLAGPQLFLSSPIFGVGLGGYHAITGDASHDWYMTVLAEEGLVGAALWVLMLLAYALGMRRREMTPRSIGFACLAVLAVGSLFTDPPHEDQSSLTTATILTAAYVAEWARSRRVRPRGPVATVPGSRRTRPWPAAPAKA